MVYSNKVRTSCILSDPILQECLYDDAYIKEPGTQQGIWQMRLQCRRNFSFFIIYLVESKMVYWFKTTQGLQV